MLEKSTEDDWWKAKKRAPGEEEEEPVGLIPNNYVQEVGPFSGCSSDQGVYRALIPNITCVACVTRFALNPSMS